MEDDYTGGDICIDGSTDCIGNDIVYGSRTHIHLKNKPLRLEGLFIELSSETLSGDLCLSLLERFQSGS